MPAHPEAAHASLVERLRAAGCVFAEDEAALLVAEAASAEQLESMTQARVDGEPLEYLLGWVEFCGLRLAVSPGVFVPRQRTGLLVAQSVRLLRTAPDGAVLDLCCGVGAVGAALLDAMPRLTLHAADVDPAALACARTNLPDGARVHRGDLFAALPSALRGTFQVVVANAPYVPTAEIELMPPEARDHEAPRALDGGSDGLAVHRRIAAEVGDWLAPGGSVLLESSRNQAAADVALLAAAGLTARSVHSAELDATVVIGTSVSAGSGG